MNHKHCWCALILLSAVVAAFAMGSARKPGDTQPSGAPNQAQMRERQQLRAQVMRRIAEGDFNGAGVVAQSIVATAVDGFDMVDGHRMLGLVAKRSGNIQVAKAHLTTAMNQLETRPALEAKFPWLRSTILMDRAEIAAFHESDVQTALNLYATVIAQGGAARPREVWIAIQNTAMLLAELADHQAAADKVEQLLAIPAVVAAVPAPELVAIKAARVNWLAAAGDLPAAYAAALTFWNEHQNGNDTAVFEIGGTLAGWYPMPTDCMNRLALCQTVLGKIATVRGLQVTGAAGARAPDLAALSQFERQIWTVMANSTDCNQPAIVAWARIQLGLPPIDLPPP